MIVEKIERGSKGAITLYCLYECMFRDVPARFLEHMDFIKGDKDYSALLDYMKRTYKDFTEEETVTIFYNPSDFRQ